MIGRVIRPAILLIALVSLAIFADASAIDDLNNLMDSTRIVEADVFAPKMYKKAAEAADKARQAIRQGKKEKTRAKHISEANEYAENALRAAEVAKLSLNEYLPGREKAKVAKASILVPELFNKAEIQFKKATENIESGNVKKGLKEAEKSLRLYDIAEIEAIRKDILGPADILTAAAVSDGAEKYALTTLDKARTARAKGNAILTQDRYDRKEAEIEAARAEYEARHASNIAQSVRSLNRNDQAWEKLMMIYEIQMNRVGAEVGAGRLPFDHGPLAAADSMIYYINDLKNRNTALEETITDISNQLKSTLVTLEYKNTDVEPIKLAAIVDEEVVRMKGDIARVSTELTTAQTEATEMASTHEEMAAELEERKAQEEKFRKAKSILNPSEGEVLFNSSNDVVLRLSGLSFDVGKSDIKDKHMELLVKVRGIIEMFPDSKLMVEGHTDATGDANSNTFLSEKRAFAVMQYLRQSMLIPADRIRSIGYGAEKPVASNQNSEGRAKNRRIDIIIMR